jgi:hypothetical protein
MAMRFFSPPLMSAVGASSLSWYCGRSSCIIRCHALAYVSVCGRIRQRVSIREKLLYHPLRGCCSSVAALLQLCCSLLQLIRCEAAPNTLTNTLRSKQIGSNTGHLAAKKKKTSRALRLSIPLEARSKLRRP